MSRESGPTPEEMGLTQEQWNKHTEKEKEIAKGRHKVDVDAVKNAPGLFKKTREKNAMGVLHEKAKFENKLRDEAAHLTKIYGHPFRYNPERLSGIEEVKAEEPVKQLSSKFELKKELPSNFNHQLEIFKKQKISDQEGYQMTVGELAEMAWGGTATGLRGEEMYEKWKDEDFLELLKQMGEDWAVKKVEKAKETGFFKKF